MLRWDATSGEGTMYFARGRRVNYGGQTVDCGRLFFPKMNATVSSIPHGFLRYDYDTPIESRF